ncbi:MAG: DUF4333 domain-containing protein [Cyanobacteria bacterium P01_A01_bin.123]
MGIWLQRIAGIGTLSGVLLSACGQLNTQQLEADIEAEIEGQGHRVSLQSVQCPDGITQQEGVVFFCVGEIDPEGNFNIEVVQEDNQGDVAWTVESSRVIINLATLEAELETGLVQAIGRRSPVDCGAAYRLNQPSIAFECNVVGDPVQGQDRITAILVTTDGQGNVQWEEIRHTQAPTEATDEATDEAGEATDDTSNANQLENAQSDLAAQSNAVDLSSED